ncbi:MAG TPA: cytochrome c oxidase assembly protein [Terriglobales bacterium]|nr:cytochrome c oxidase assembly protein [Terriglobales bacterium]
MYLKGCQIAAVGTVAIFTATPAWSLAETERGLVNQWAWPPAILIPLLLTAGLYGLGVMRMLRRSSNRRSFLWPVLSFALGWISLVLALDSPLHELGEQLFWVHMTQHEILMLISAPLLVLGRPLIAFLWALPRAWRETAAKVGRSGIFKKGWTFTSAPLSAWLVSALALWIWHLPWLFDQTLRSDSIHAAQHTTFLVTALIFWWPVVNRTSALGYGGGLVYIFTTILHTSVLGALLTFATRPWYSSYEMTAPAWHLTALEDQQIGGLIMWIPAGTVLLIVALVLLVKWIQESQTRWQYTRMAEYGRLSGEGGTQ